MSALAEQRVVRREIDPMAYLHLLPIAMAPIVRRLPSHVPFEDLQAVAYCALSNAIHLFEGPDESEIEGWLVWKTRCGVLDELRRLDPLSRQERTKIKRLRRAEEALVQKLDRSPTNEELAEATGLPLKEVRSAIALASLREVEISDIVDLVDETVADPADLASAADDRANLKVALSSLPSREAEVIHGIYFEKLKLAEIAASLGVTEPRVSHIRDQAIRRLRASFEDSRWALQNSER